MCEHIIGTVIQRLGAYTLWRCDCNKLFMTEPPTLINNIEYIRPVSTREGIILAVANGCRTTRAISEWLGLPRNSGTVRNYFYYYRIDWKAAFVNGKILQWEEKLASTIRLAPNVGKLTTMAGDKRVVVGVYGR